DAGDVIQTGSGRDIIFGDNARLAFELVLEAGQPAAQLRRGFTIDPAAGGDDDISAGDGNDIVIGGTAADVIRGGAGDDRLFGDHGLFDLDLPENQRIISIFTG